MRKQDLMINGKDYSRAYRRHMKYVKTKKRSLKWLGNDSSLFDCTTIADALDKVFKGEYWQFLRTTGKPCSCDICSENFKREQKQYWDCGQK